ncbi:hypothetical protein BV96_01241 [Sphingomonas paucimobilis]|nr:hypothetical protein BV96_01241 [Sphingomonas paucimobilis]
MIRFLLALLALTFAAHPALAAPGTAVQKGRIVQGTAQKPCKVDYAYKWLDGMKGDATGMVVDGCDIRVSFRGIELAKPPESPLGVAKYVVVRNSTFSLVRPATPATAIPTGIQCKWGESILIENVTATGFQAVPGKGYANGDGFGSEYCIGLTYRNVTASDNANGGFDDKAHRVLYHNTLSARNDYGYRMWWRGPGNFTGTTMTCEDNRVSCLHLMAGTKSGAAHATIDHLVVHFAKGAKITPILIAQPGTALTVGRCTITADETPSAPVAFGGTKASRKLGPGCMDAAGNIIWSKPKPSAAAAVAAVPQRGINLGEVLADGDGDGLIVLSNKAADRLKLPRGTVLKAWGGMRYAIIR